MAHIPLSSAAPGIRGLLDSYPESGGVLMALAEHLLRGPSPLRPAERELIAAYVSSINECEYCTESHAATARALYGSEAGIVDEALRHGPNALSDRKIRAMLHIAAKTARSGNAVSAGDVEDAIRAELDDRMIHDTVLIAAAFCMYNRYVDGLGTDVPADRAAYRDMGAALARNGYGRPMTRK